jgi:hypothetical protein
VSGSLLGKERLDDRRDILGLVDHEQVAAVGDDVASAIRDQPTEEPGVDQRDDRIAATGEDERRGRQRA